MGWSRKFDESVGGTHYTTASGKSYFWYYKKPSRKSSPRSHLLVKAQTPAVFEIVPEDFAVKIAKNLGFTAEFQTNDMEFDKRFYIFSDDVQLCGKLRTQAMRAAVQQIFDAGGKRIEAVDGSIKVLMKEATLVPDPLNADKVAEALHVIAEHIAGLIINPTSVCKSLRKRASTAVGTFITLFFVGAFTLAQTHTVASQVPIMKQAALYAFPIIIFIFILIRAQFRGSSYGVSVFFWGLICGVPGVAMLSYGGIYHANIHMDKSPSEAVYTQIVSKHIYRRKSSNVYYVKVENWQQRDSLIKIRVFSEEYQRMASGQSLKLHVHPGYFNVGWVEKYEELQ
ncbi:MAG: hypothetical protein ACK502_05675 [Alphaproteobacteria bacterium]